MSIPLGAVGLRVRTARASVDARDDLAPTEAEGVVVVDLGGPPGAEVVGVSVGGRLVFRNFTSECQVLFN